jgi:hypothetical protein
MMIFCGSRNSAHICGVSAAQQSAGRKWHSRRYANKQRQGEKFMHTEHGLRIGGLLVFGLACGLLGAAPARADSTQPAGEPQAAPSQLPASQATTNAVSGQKTPASSTETGTQQAAPSAKPANEATPGTVDAPDIKKNDD